MRLSLPILILLFAGCGEARSLAVSLDSKTEPTWNFWTAMNGVRWRTRKQVGDIGAELQSAAALNDGKEKAVAAAMRRLSAYAQRRADLFGSVRSDGADPEAVEFQAGAVSDYESLAAAAGDVADAVETGDVTALLEAKQQLAQVQQTIKDREAAHDQMTDTLSARYDRDFTAVDRHD